jgi:aspartyl-tRNA(Asn)/glutamyl-tRNA(Gln) amidotransferase subunit B
MSSPQTILDKYPEYQLDIGIEVHVQISTESKIFCCSPNGPVDIPNSSIDPVCVGYPGVLPMLNKKVVDYAILTGLATNCTINQESEFARKHYFYPDLPKGYQTTQDDKPICLDGHVQIKLEDGSAKNIRIMRIHMEEDAGKNIHSETEDKSFVDLNRAGSPLLEIVTQPDIKSTYEARTYLKTLHTIVTYLGVCTGDMEKGVFRADTNISVRKKGCDTLGTRCELKNINSFKFISDAIEYEVERQIKLLEQGEKIIQQTRLWNTRDRKTVAMRSKEEAADYRYFPDPDLPKVYVDDAWIERMRKQIPELPQAKLERLMNDYHIKHDDADILVHDPETAHYFELATKTCSSKILINWLLRDVLGYAKEHKVPLAELKITPEKLGALVALIDNGIINTRAAQEVFAAVAETGDSPEAIVKKLGLEQMDNSAELEQIILDLIKANQKQADAYRAGNLKLMGFFVGQAMAKTQGRGNPTTVQELLKKHL